MTKLVKDKDKLSVFFDHNLDLKSIWSADATRNWLIYSRESFRKFWDVQAKEGER